MTRRATTESDITIGDRRSWRTAGLRGWLYGLVARNSFRGAILRPIVAITAILVLFLCHYMTSRFLSYCQVLYDSKMYANINALRLYLSDAENHTRVAANTMAQNRQAVQAIKSKNRADIIKIFSSTLDFYGVTHYTVCDGGGVVLARTLAPERFGDSISHQYGISEALRGEPSTIFEQGSVARVAASTKVPVRDAGGNVIGVVAAGVRFDTDEVVDGLRELFKADVSFTLGDTRIATTLKRKDGQRINGTRIDPQTVKIVVDSKNEHFGNVNILGEDHNAFYMPLLDFSGKVFATFFIGEPTSTFSAKINSLVYQGIAIGLVGLIISIGLLSAIVTVLSKDIAILSRDMKGVAQGSLDIWVNVVRKDEVGRLAKSMKKVVDTISKLLQDINEMIAEHEKGNTHHRIDVDSLQGEFRVLASNILKLSDMGIRDHLTGLPNRRSFDGRFELEWSRAKRDEASIALLMLDLDRFKDYNDRFGHQQGDVALQETARAIVRVIKRRVDFAARWGGEEFAVLLPNTDLGGAMTVASGIREEIEKTAIPCADQGAAKMTISIGVNAMRPTRSSSPTSLVSGADEALYKAKQLGRNRVEPWT
jgi:diguanylate cyclase (GGDEF)-like protein